MLLSHALERANKGLAEMPFRLEVDRHWCEPPTLESHTVSYRRDLRGGAHQAIIDGVSVSLDDPCRLLPVEIAKPWGKEVWYTGIEARGESRVATGGGQDLPLGTYLALAPGHLTNGHTPILLKILDPLPAPVIGELYLEVHETKREVYVVTAVDPDAWPDGRGRIRYGVNQARRREFADDEAFRAAFLAALGEYEAARMESDAGAVGLAEREARARAACLTFTDERSLAVGDVITVPTWLPHSLQHGVRVVEFQTPTYERFILSSSQKVLTQDAWDSAHAVANMRLDTPKESAPEVVGKHVERIVRFDDFGVWQARLAEGESIRLPESAPYAVAFCITGQIHLNGPAKDLHLSAGDAALIPAAAVGLDIKAATGSLLLLAAPDL